MELFADVDGLLFLSFTKVDVLEQFVRDQLQRVLRPRLYNRPTVHSQCYYFASAAVAVDSSHMTVSSSASWSRFSPPSNVVNGHVSVFSYRGVYAI